MHHRYAVRGSSGILQSAPFKAGHRDTWSAFPVPRYFSYLVLIPGGNPIVQQESVEIHGALWRV